MLLLTCQHGFCDQLRHQFTYVLGNLFPRDHPDCFDKFLHDLWNKLIHNLYCGPLLHSFLRNQAHHVTDLFQNASREDLLNGAH